jgi:hypothetical protein
MSKPAAMSLALHIELLTRRLCVNTASSLLFSQPRPFASQFSCEPQRDHAVSYSLGGMG